MLINIFNHFRLVLRLLMDKRVKISLKSLIIIPFFYFILPFPDDFFHLIGFIDDMFILAITSIIFAAACPKNLILEHKEFLNTGVYPNDFINYERYRSRSETRDLALAFAIVVTILLIFGYFAGALLILLFVRSYIVTDLKRKEMLSNAVKVGPNQFPDIYKEFQEVLNLLSPVKVNLLIIQSPEMNAWTFGFNEPYTIILTSTLIDKLSKEEIKAVIGHEAGHILFGHVNVISIINAQSILGNLFFSKWSRSCEYSADAIALITSNGNYLPVVSALLKLTVGLPDTVNIEDFLSQLEKDNKVFNLEIIRTHPYINHRIKSVIDLADEDDLEKEIENKKKNL